MIIPFYRPSIGTDEVERVIACLESGWLTTGPVTKSFEIEFAHYVGAKYAIAVNSATAALHLALEAIGLSRGESVLVPTMTFAATAEVVRYFDAKPIMVDCCKDSLNIDILDARKKATLAVGRGEKLRAIIPVHYGGEAVDMLGVRALASEFRLRVVEDAAHCCPAGYRDPRSNEWKKVGSESDVCCYSFYANKCITTGEGGMACTNDESLADRIRIMSLHGISKDAWKRYTAEGSWYYEIVAPGFKYNLTDIASSIGLAQLAKSDLFRDERESLARRYMVALASVSSIILPLINEDRIHSWHLFVVRLRLSAIRIDRNTVIDRLKKLGVSTSVHWMPLHMHPYYRDTYSYSEEMFPESSRIYKEIISLPLYPGMRPDQIDYVANALSVILLEESL